MAFQVQKDSEAFEKWAPGFTVPWFPGAVLFTVPGLPGLPGLPGMVDIQYLGLLGLWLTN